ncbi:MAG TPA: PD-(D/E)XK nuclease family protein [Oscillatoriaceae cyanobacterium M33_DOE_052]|uniref:Cell division protein FtsK n=1 Tax=Planktothricoides sp. SpSt-374 TaxID=2282167 RepID=A0A7C3VP33_9CYAN|nr:PD-(D/E)XK nuclease family protein [Oscillatoriaceae cyanobacterium M33_DOE_052]
MLYLQDSSQIHAYIDILAKQKIIWADTEVADWDTTHPRLSLIQVLTDANDINGSSTYIFDVLDKPDLVTAFIQRIMVNPLIEKVFHNASYDLRFLGKNTARNVTCTFKLAKKITPPRLGVPNLKLKTLAARFGDFADINKAEQGSDWGQRPLTPAQLQYAKMDPVYLAVVHRSLREFDSMPKSTSSSFSVTQVRVAFECPRLFYLAESFGGKTLFLPPSSTGGVGSLFHEFAQKLVNLAKQDAAVQALFSPAADKLNAADVAAQLQERFYKQEFFGYIQHHPQDVAALLQIWEGLKGLIKHYSQLLVSNRQKFSADEVAAQTFIGEEVSLEHEFDLPDGTKQLVRGKFDCLIYDATANRLCAVEYKTYEPTDLSAQLAQVSLYSYMVWKSRNVPVDAAVYCVLPEFKSYRFEWEQLENTVHESLPYKLQQMRSWLTWQQHQPDPPPATIHPHLCAICPQQHKCQNFFNPASAIAPPPPPPTVTPPPPTVNADQIGQKLVTVFSSYKIGVDYIGASVGPAFIRFKLKPHLGVKVVSLLTRSEDIKVHLAIPAWPLITAQAGYVSVDVPRPDREIARFEDYIHPETRPADAPMHIAIGVNLEGKLVEADLSNPNTCHFLVGGTTGSGKSEFLRSILLSLVRRHSPAQLQIALVDPKRVTFPEFEHMPWLHSPIVYDTEAAIDLMSQLVEEMEERYRKFQAQRCADIITYNRQNVKQILPRILCIFDEYADFMADKTSRGNLEDSIKRLGAKARSAGIHLIVATQRPEAKVVTPLIRSNLPGRVALRTASEADSKIILGGSEIGSAYLLGKGDLLYQGGDGMQRLQSLLALDVSL